MTGAPLFVSSGDLIADRRYKWALDHAARGDLAAAADILVQTLERAPRFAGAWFALGTLRDALGDRAAALAAFAAARDADPEDYHGARLHLARLEAGDAVPAMSEVYVRRLFDHHAADFEISLVERLRYRGPQLIRDALARACRDAGRPLHFAAMLDLGCGTGLAGTALRPCVRHLVGVDLSPGMVELARGKAIYDRLELAELMHFLRRLAVEPTGDRGGAVRRFDLVVAADVFVYVADIAAAVAAVAPVLAQGGLLAFTTETHAGPGVLLRETLRYAHGRETVLGALAAAGLAPLVLENAWARTEKGLPAPGLVVVAGEEGRMAPPGEASVCP